MFGTDALSTLHFLNTWLKAEDIEPMEAKDTEFLPYDTLYNPRLGTENHYIFQGLRVRGLVVRGHQGSCKAANTPVPDLACGHNYTILGICQNLKKCIVIGVFYCMCFIS